MSERIYLTKYIANKIIVNKINKNIILLFCFILTIFYFLFLKSFYFNELFKQKNFFDFYNIFIDGYISCISLTSNIFFKTLER